MEKASGTCFFIRSSCTGACNPTRTLWRSARRHRNLIGCAMPAPMTWRGRRRYRSRLWGRWRWRYSCRRRRGAGGLPVRLPTNCRGNMLIERWPCWCAGARVIRSACARRSTVPRRCIYWRASLNRVTAGPDPPAFSFCRRKIWRDCLHCCEIPALAARRMRQRITPDPARGKRKPRFPRCRDGDYFALISVQMRLSN